jgi:hypothetical protein
VSSTSPLGESLIARVVISPGKNPRKPVSILREGVKDYKLLNHIKLLITDSTVEEIEDCERIEFEIRTHLL